MQIIENMAMKEYRGNPALSASELKTILKSPKAYYQQYILGKREHSNAMELGTAVHMAVFEPQLFDQTYVIPPEGMKFTTKEGKEWRKEQKGVVLSNSEWSTICGIKNAIDTESIVSEGIEVQISDFVKGTPEVSIFWESNGTQFKARPDCLNKVQKRIVDLKTAADASPEGFAKACFAFGYHISAAHYLNGIKSITGEDYEYLFLVTEKNMPYRVGLYRLDENAISLGTIQILESVEKLKNFELANYYPSFSGKLETLELPRWAYKGR